jgi:ADP-ribose pyrophosphatase YjhB (NUDIX family)
LTKYWPMLQIVCALVRRESDVLLVRQQGPEDFEPYWTLPAGVAESGELTTETLVREVREETGLEVLDPGHLAFILLYDEPDRSGQSSVYCYCFDVAAWDGEISCEDPDDLVSEARFFPLEEAVGKLAKVPWSEMRETVAYLTGETGPGAFWLYRRGLNGTDNW